MGAAAPPAVDNAAHRPSSHEGAGGLDPWQPLLAFARTLRTEMAAPPGQQGAGPHPDCCAGNRTVESRTFTCRRRIGAR